MFFSTSFLHASFLVRLCFSSKRFHLSCRTDTFSGMYGMLIDTIQNSWSVGTGFCLLQSWEQLSTLFFLSWNVIHEVEGGRQCAPAHMLLCNQGTVKRGGLFWARRWKVFLQTLLITFYSIVFRRNTQPAMLYVLFDFPSFSER